MPYVPHSLGDAIRTDASSTNRIEKRHRHRTLSCRITGMTCHRYQCPSNRGVAKQLKTFKRAQIATASLSRNTFQDLLFSWLPNSDSAVDAKLSSQSCRCGSSRSIFIAPSAGHKSDSQQQMNFGLRAQAFRRSCRKLEKDSIESPSPLFQQHQRRASINLATTHRHRLFKR